MYTYTMPFLPETSMLRFCLDLLTILCAGFAHVLEQHQTMKAESCRTREDAIEDTKAMQAAAAAVQQGIRECMVTAATNGCELSDILYIKSREHIR